MKWKTNSTLQGTTNKTASGLELLLRVVHAVTPETAFTKPCMKEPPVLTGHQILCQMNLRIVALSAEKYSADNATMRVLGIGTL